MRSRGALHKRMQSRRDGLYIPVVVAGLVLAASLVFVLNRFVNTSGSQEANSPFEHEPSLSELLPITVEVHATPRVTSTPAVSAAIDDVPIATTPAVEGTLLAESTPFPASTDASRPAALPPQATATTGAALQPTDTELPGADALREKIVAAERDLRSGELEARSAGDGTATLTAVRFDFGADNTPPRLQITTTLTSTTGIQTVTYVQIGTEAWVSQPDGRLLRITVEGNVRDKVQRFLPRAADATAARYSSKQKDVALEWNEQPGGAQIQLQVDPHTGIPYKMQRMTAQGDDASEIHYLGWNTPVAITPPSSAIP